MIRHVALFAWTDDVTKEQVGQLASDLAALPAQMGGLRDYRFGPDAGLVEGNADFAVVADFDDAESCMAYRNHPAHRDVIERMITPMSRRRMSAQFEI